jgi:hypothetical protein
MNESRPLAAERNAEAHAKERREQDHVGKVRHEPDLPGDPADEAELEREKSERTERELEGPRPIAVWPRRVELDVRSRGAVRTSARRHGRRILRCVSR